MLVKGMAVVALQVQRKVDRPDEGILKLPGPLMSNHQAKAFSAIHWPAASGERSPLYEHR
jgi:hypothetical protein